MEGLGAQLVNRVLLQALVIDLAIGGSTNRADYNNISRSFVGS